jgi:hypothetical protein
MTIIFTIQYLNKYIINTMRAHLTLDDTLLQDQAEILFEHNLRTFKEA